jgi:hypothetical protein
MKTGVRNMNWTDLQKNWVPLSDINKFRKYAKENSIESPRNNEKESYFESDRGAFYGNITEFDFTNISNIESEILRIMENSCLKNSELIARIIAITMMKMQPKEITVRERFNAWDNPVYKEVGLPSTSHDIAEVNATAKNNAPPDFYYPM